MATLKRRLNRYNATSKAFDVMHLETESGIVLRADGSTVEAALTALEGKSHAANSVTTGTDTAATPAFGGNFTFVSSVATNSNGHVTTVKTKQITLPSPATMKAATSSAAGSAGYVPAPAAGKQSQYLRGDGTWATPTNTTYSDVKGATSSAAGTHGLVPAPASGKTSQFLRSDGTWSDTFTAAVNVPTAAAGTNTTQAASTAFVTAAVNALLEAKDAFVFKGTLAFGADLPAANAGHVYRVVASSDNTSATSGTIGGITVHLNDTLTCLTDGTAAKTAANWIVTHTNHTGEVMGPASSVDSHVATFDGATGKLIKDSGFTIGKSVPSDAKFTDTTYSDMKAATSSAAGTHGLVPAPAAGNQGKYLRGDGTWQTPTNTVYKHPTSGVTAGSYGPGSNATIAHGGTLSVPQVTVDANGHVTSAASRTITFPAAPTSVSGNAGTATKLQTARTITFSGAATGSFTFDGSANKTCTLTSTAPAISFASTQPTDQKEGDLWYEEIS